MLITSKVLGSKKPLFADFSVPIPPDLDEDGEGGFTLRDLIECVVHHEVAAFSQRQTERQFVRALSANEIDTGSELGKVEMGGSEIAPQKVDLDEAVQAALVAFEDGLYLVAIDEERYTNLDQPVYVSEESRVTFVRLTFLSGA